MPLIRPIGRNITSYNSWMQRSPTQMFEDNSVGVIPATSPLPSGHTRHCELWIQTAEITNLLVTNKLKEITNQHPSSFFAYFDCTKPLWQPFADNFQNCPDAKTNPMNAKPFCALEETTIAILLKLIWVRASEVLCNNCYHNDSLRLIPLNDYSDQIRLIKTVIEDINLLDFNLSTEDSKLDPTRIIGSHLALYSINAFIDANQIQHPEPLENIYYDKRYPGIATRPSCFLLKKDFLNWLNTVSPRRLS
jgi:hypothetical protein